MTDAKINELAELVYRQQCPQGNWAKALESTQEWYRRGVRLVLEQAGVDAMQAKLAEKDAEIARLREAAIELTQWDWSHLLANHPDSQEVMADVRRIESALDSGERSWT